MADEADGKDNKTMALIIEACKAFGIARKFVLGSRVDENGRAVIVTHGGAKVIYRAGDKVEPLTEVQITGVNKEAEARRRKLTGEKARKQAGK